MKDAYTVLAKMFCRYQLRPHHYGLYLKCFSIKIVQMSKKENTK